MPTRNRIIIILTFIIGFVLLMMLIFGGGSKKKSTSSTKAAVQKPIVLTDYANRDSKVVFSIDGPVNNDQDHRGIRISVGRGSTLVEVVQGYQNNVIKSQRTDNNPDAYDVFVRAIARLGFGKERKTSLTDSRGVCPTGRRYFTQLVDNNDEKMNLWTSSCKGGTTSADIPNIQLLFQKQVPGYSKFISGVQL